MNPPKNILVVKLTSLGDIVQSTGIIRTLKENFKDTKIWFATASRNVPLIAKNPHLHAVLPIPTQEKLSLSQLRSFFSEKTQAPFDLAIDLQGTAISSRCLYASGAQRMLGFAEGPRLRWERVYDYQHDVHAIRDMARVASDLGCAIHDLSPEIYLDAAFEAPAIQKLKTLGLSKNYIVFHPFCAWDSKNWPLENYAELSKGMSSYPVLITGSEEDQKKFCSEIFPRNVVNGLGMFSLEEALWVWKGARLFVSGDTGPMHAAAALGTHLISLFGPTLVTRTAPWNLGEEVIQFERPPHPYFERTEKDGALMRAIPVESVLARAKERLTL